jgi:coenzyme F420-reducing hydrogenase alpha subunit
MVQQASSTDAQEIDLTQYTEFFAQAVPDGTPVVVGTTSPDGTPDVALKGSFMVWDKDHVAFWERARGETLAALRANKKLVAMYRNSNRLRGQLRLYGEVVELLEDGDLREQVWDRTIETEQKADPEKKGVGVIARVDRVRLGPTVIVRAR